MRLVSRFFAVGLVLSVLGCGTTVPAALQAQGPAAGTVDAGPSPPTVTGGRLPQGGQATAPAEGAARGPQRTVEQGPLGNTAPGVQAGVVRPGSVRVGFEVSDADAYFRSLGFANLTTGNTTNQVRALVAYMNGHGGLGGRRIEPVLYQVPTVDNGTKAQEECDFFTRDHHVFAVLGAGAGSSFALFTCLAKAGTVYVDGYGSQTEAAAKELRGYWYDPADFVLDRFARAYVEQLVGLGFFTKGARIGLLSYDDPAFRSVVERVVKPTLARHGLRVTDEADFSTSAYASQGQAFVLRFQTDGITHVLNLVAGVVVFFQRAAESQQYRPRYALSSRDGPGAWVQVLAPPAQLKGSLGIGWQPLADVDLAHSPGDVSPNQTLCRKVMKDAGEDVSNQGVQVASHRYCETVFFLRAAFQHLTVTSPGGLLEAVARLGRGYPPVMTFTTSFSKNRSDGPEQIRPFTFQDDCSCFVYSGRAQSVSR
jgi:hypothetical protein